MAYHTNAQIRAPTHAAAREPEHDIKITLGGGVGPPHSAILM